MSPVRNIVPLQDAPHLKPALVQWYIDEWMPWYGPGGGGDARADIEEYCTSDDLPVCLVALGPDEQLLGTAALKNESVGSEHGYAPWLAALLVAKDHRRQGVATALVEAIEGSARERGYPALYCSTDSAETILTRRSWTAVNESESLRGTVTIMRLVL